MNFEYFFIYTKLIEEQQLDIGFQLYSPGHLIWLGALLIMGIILSSWYKKQKQQLQLKTRKMMAVGLLLSEILKDGIIIAVGAPFIEYLPLHLCSFAIFGLLYDAFGKNRKLSTQMIAYAFFPGATAALLFCNWTEYPFLNYMSIHSFLFHGVIVFYFLMLYRSGEIVPNYKGIWKTMKVIGAVAPFVFVFNLFTGQNYLFLNEASPGSPLVPIWNIFGTTFGLPGYLFGVILLVIVVFHGLYGLYMVLEKVKEKRGKENEREESYQKEA